MLTLASRSPRRAQILAQLQIPFRVEVAAVSEENIDGSLQERVEQLARAKALAVTARGVVLGADTLISIDGEIIGKPEDGAAAKRILRRLSGRKHQVMTGLATVGAGKILSGSQLTVVKMRSLTELDIERYVATGEPLDKAGAYGIQGIGAALIEGIEGCYYNVVGLPMDLLVRQLAAFDLKIGRG